MAVATLLGAIAAFGYTKAQPTQYRATASAQVFAGDSRSVADAFSGNQLAMQRAAQYAALAGTSSVAEKTISIGKLTGDETSVAYSVTASASASIPTIYVSAVSRSPELAAKVADAAVLALKDVAYDFETHNAVPASTSAAAGASGQAGQTTSAGPATVIQVVPTQKAAVPSAPFSPNMKYNLLIGAIAGLALGYLLAFLRRKVDTRVRSAADMESLTQASPLAVIPRTSELASDDRGGSIDRLGEAAEAIRQLRTNLHFVNVDHGPRTIVVTSANPGEGKSTLAANLARALAAAGQPTILVDADLRRPMAASIFGADSAVGLTQVLAGDVPVRDVLHPANQDGLYVLPAGRIPSNPSELLGSRRMNALLQSLSRDYLVILDAPPLLPVTDATLLSTVCDGAILVVRYGKTYKDQVRMCQLRLSQVDGRLIGSVINLAPKRALGSVVYGYGYSRRYGRSVYSTEYESPKMPDADTAISEEVLTQN